MLSWLYVQIYLNMLWRVWAKLKTIEFVWRLFFHRSNADLYYTSFSRLCRTKSRREGINSVEGMDLEIPGTNLPSGKFKWKRRGTGLTKHSGQCCDRRRGKIVKLLKRSNRSPEILKFFSFSWQDRSSTSQKFHTIDVGVEIDFESSQTAQ